MNLIIIAFMVLVNFLMPIGEATAPMVFNPIPDQAALIGQGFDYPIITDDHFSDSDRDCLHLNPTKADNSSLPSWLSFDSYIRKTYQQSTGYLWDNSDFNSQSNYLYAVSSHRLFCYDATNLAVPVLKQIINLADDPSDVLTRGIALFLLHDSGGEVFNISDPANPIHVKTFHTIGGSILAMDNEGNYLYVGRAWVHPSATNTWNIYNVSDLFNPILVNSFGGPYLHRDIFIIGNLLYSSDSNLKIFDITNRTDPVLVGGFSSGYDVRSTVVRDNIAYVATTSLIAGMQIVNVTDKTNPSLIGTYTDNLDWAHKITVSGKWAFISGYHDGGADMIDISDPISCFLLYAPYVLAILRY